MLCFENVLFRRGTLKIGRYTLPETMDFRAKLTVGRLHMLLGFGLFSGANYVSFREGMTN